MSKWKNNALVADEPKQKEKTPVQLLEEISAKLDVVISRMAEPEETTPEEDLGV